MEGDIVVNRALLKAIGADSRIAILKSLANGRKTQSQLAAELGLSPPTVLEHLEHLSSAGLTEKIDEGRKWKYYELTALGKKLAAPKPGFPARAIILLVTGLIFMAFSGFSLLYPAAAPQFAADSGDISYQGGAMPLLGTSMNAASEEKSIPPGTIINAADEPASRQTDEQSSTEQQEPNAALEYAALGIGAAMLLCGLYGIARRMAPARG